MLPSHHAAAAVLAALPLRKRGWSPLAIAQFAAAAVLIDADHYASYVWRIGDLSLEIPTPDGPLTIRDLSVSVGGATFPDDAVDLPALVQVADSAMYAAKQAGKNRLAFYTSGPAANEAAGGERSYAA